MQAAGIPLTLGAPGIPCNLPGPDAAASRPRAASATGEATSAPREDDDAYYRELEESAAATLAAGLCKPEPVHVQAPNSSLHGLLSQLHMPQQHQTHHQHHQLPPHHHHGMYQQMAYAPAPMAPAQAVQVQAAPVAGQQGQGQQQQGQYVVLQLQPSQYSAFRPVMHAPMAIPAI